MAAAGAAAAVAGAVVPVGVTRQPRRTTARCLTCRAGSRISRIPAPAVRSGHGGTRAAAGAEASPGAGGILHHDPAVNLRLLPTVTSRNRETAYGPAAAASVRRSHPALVPHLASPGVGKPALFERLTRTLFFTFYYQQGRATVLGGEGLKRPTGGFTRSTPRGLRGRRSPR